MTTTLRMRNLMNLIEAVAIVGVITLGLPAVALVLGRSRAADTWRDGWAEAGRLLGLTEEDER